MRASLAVAAVAVTILGCGGEPSAVAERYRRGSHTTAAARPAEVERTFVIFADVTRSLTREEHAAVYANVQRVVQILPENATLIVFPILEDVQRAGAVFQGRLPAVKSTADSVDFKVKQTQWIKQVVEKLRAIDEGSDVGRKRTCISGALRKAEEVTVDARPDRPVEVVIVSDMLEDCDDSLLGGKLSLEKTSIAQDLQTVRALPKEPLLHLNGASITVLLPTVPTTQSITKRPPVHELRALWREILDRSGDQKANFRFGTQMPQRLLDFQQTTTGGL